MMCPYRSRLWLSAFFLLGMFVGNISAEEPLHDQIDAVLAKSRFGPSAAGASDAAFLRRIYLDLTGRIPSADAARKFLDDNSPDKRQRLIEELLQSPACDRRLATVFDIMFMERRGGKHVKSAAWDAYLLASMKENKPYNVLAREILSADGVDPKHRAPAKFYMDRDDMAVNLVTRDTARVFFGRDIECAQCHDHPLISDYEQSEYYGILAFLDRSYIFQPDKKKPAVIAEKAEGVVKFKSVFTGYEGETRPRLPGETEITEPTFKKGEEYKIKPAKNVRPVPEYSRREKFAELATAGSNEYFNKNIANRLWAVMLGQGLVNPVDLHHSENPPTSPELLDLLAKRFVAMKFDIKDFLKEIALSETYQRSFRMPDSLAENIRLARQELPKARAEQAGHQQQAESFAKPLDELYDAIKKHQEAAKPLREKSKTLQTQLAAAEKKHTEAQAALTKLQSSLKAKKEVANLLAEAAAKANLAAQKLPDDKALSQSSTAIAAQSQAWANQAVAVQKQFDQQAAATKTSQTQLAAVKKQSQETQTELAKVESLIKQTEADYQTARDKKKSALLMAEAAGRKIERLKLLLDYAATSQNLQAAQSRVHSLQTELTAAQAEAAGNVDRLAKHKQQLAEVQKTHNETMETLAAKKELLNNHTQAARLVAEAFVKVEAAQKQLPEDKQLAAVVERLESARASQSQKETSVGDEVQKLEASAKETAADLGSLETIITETEAALKQSQANTVSLQTRQKELQTELGKAEGAFEQADIQLAESWTKHFRVANLEHLSPEQLAWSVLEAVGQVEQQKAAALAAWNKKHPDHAKKDLTPEQEAERAEFIEQTVQAKLNGLVKKFLPLFAASAGQPQHEFFATVDQALFFANGNDVLSWLRPGGGNLTDRLRKMSDPNQFADELYLSILTRRPTKEEIQDVTNYLNQRKDDRDPAIQEMAWALLTSAEFRFQH